MAISKQPFGKLPDGRTTELFRLDGGRGVSAAITNFGGIIASLRAPDRDGNPGEIGLGFATLDEYLAKNKFYGALIGRVANRIGGGQFSLDDKRYQLWVNPANGNHLHGGKEGFHRKLWEATVEDEILRLDYLSPDGEGNYPGNLAVTVRYSLLGRDLRIEYEAATDKPTIVNLTNHEFFNLNGCARDVLAHELRADADAYTPVDASLIPTGEILPVDGTPLDFRRGKAIGRDIAASPGGYDHNLVFAASAGPEEWKVEVYDPDSGRTLAMATTEPCMQFYAGGFLDGSDVGIGGIPYRKNYAFCLEAQKMPDAINHPNFTPTILRPGETYRQTTVYRFGVS